MMPSSSSRWNSDISGPETLSYRPRAKRILGIQRLFIQTQTLLLEAVSREILHNTPRTDDGRCQTERKPHIVASGVDVTMCIHLVFTFRF